MRQPVRFTFSLCLFFLGVFTANFAQTDIENALPATKVSHLDFDGKLLEPFYADLPTLSFIQFQPAYAKTTSEDLDVYLLYDDQYLYLAGRLYASDPGLIRSRSYIRDADNPATDYFGMVVDSYNDKENALGFFTSPSGLRYDAAVNNDASGDNAISVDWNTYWDVLTHVTDRYYDVEMRVPWSSLKFGSRQDTVFMGFSIWRYMAAKNETSLFPDMSPDLGEMAPWRPSLFQKVYFKGIKSKHPLYLTPYVLLGHQRENKLNAENTGFTAERQLNYNAGLDVKYNLTSNLTMDFTLNTDFAQVESDDEQINLSRYALFRPEKRQFFQERASLFDFRFNYVNHIFYSRNIGLEDGQPVPILGGIRLTGKVGEMDVGLMNMQTAKPGIHFLDGFQADHLSNNFTVLRVKHTVFNPYSYVGAMATNKTNFRGDFNRAYGLDGVFRLRENEYLTLKWAQTFEDSLEVNPFSLDAVRFFVGYERRVFSGLSFNVNSGSAGPQYHPGMGFTSRNNYIFTNANFRYGYIFKEASAWQNLSFGLGGWADYNYAIDHFDQSQASLSVSLQAKKSWSVAAALNYNYDQLSEPLYLSEDVVLPVGDYTHPRVSVQYNSPYNTRSRLSVGYSIGRFFDGFMNSLEFEPRWNPNAHLEMSASYELNHIRFSDRDQLLVSHILRLRTLYMLNARLSVSGFLQYNNAANIFISNIKLRYNPREGNDLYIVFNEVLNSDRRRYEPEYPLLNLEVLALKYTYTFKISR